MGGRVKTLDANGSVERDVPVCLAKWGSPWVDAGVVPLGDEFVTWSGVRQFDACVYGVMRHMVGLMACGYGEEPSDIVEWFKDMAAMGWITDGATYAIDKDVDPFVGLIGSKGVMLFSDDDLPVLSLKVGGREYPIVLDTIELQKSLLIATVVDPVDLA